MYLLRLRKTSIKRCFFLLLILLGGIFMTSFYSPDVIIPLVQAQQLEQPDASGGACEIGSPNNERWAAINEYDAFFVQAAEEFNVDAHLIKAMAWIESGGQGHIDPSTGQPWVRYDGFVDHNGRQNPSIGLMQVKPGIWQSLVPDADAYDPLGNIRLGAAIMANAIQEHGSWENALTRVYFPANDPNGTTQQMYVDRVNQLMAELGSGDCGSTTGSKTNQLTPGKSACVVTKVGNPMLPPSLPPGCAGGGGGPCEVPPEPYPSDLTAAIKDTWGISIIGGPTAEQLRFIYEIFYAVSSTSFLESVRGTIIDVTARNGSISYQIGCPGDNQTDVELSSVLGEASIKVILLHELTHVYQICNENGKTNLSEIYAAYDTEGGLTEYSRTGCGLSGINLYNEDHAETIALHLNPTLSSQTCGGSVGNPYMDGGYPLHKEVAVRAVGQYSCSQ